MGNLFKAKKKTNSRKLFSGNRIQKEVDKGMKILKKIDLPLITFFGSHKTERNSKYFRHCNRLSFELGRAGFAIITGGGPGIMYAANLGAYRANTLSIGMKAGLLKEQEVNDTVYTHKLTFRFLFVRRFLLSSNSKALVFYPGGFGTLSELFEYIVLMETGIVERIPIICVGRQYWKGLFAWLEKYPLKLGYFIRGARDFKSIYFLDNINEVIDLVQRH